MPINSMVIVHNSNDLMLKLACFIIRVALSKGKSDATTEE